MSGPPFAIPASQVQPRGFVIARAPGEPQRPGSLHVQPRLARWLSLSEPGCVRVFTGKVELGQGILTALQLIAAEELDLPLASVRMESARTDRGPDEGVTSGSLSVQDSGSAIRHACAQIRGLALERAAGLAGKSEDLDVQEGRVVAPGGEVLGDYWSLLTDADLDTDYDMRWQPKPPERRRLFGRALPHRLDLADKVFGRPRFIHDLRLPGMLHGRVVRAPTLDARPATWPPAGSGDWPEGVRAWADGAFVAVVAPSERQADAVADRLRESLEWLPGAPLPDAAALPEFLRSAPSQSSEVAVRGDGLWPDAAHLRADYFKPYLTHASIGPSCAIAHWDGVHLTVWTHSQGIHNLRDDIVLALAQAGQPVARDSILVQHVEGSGCYGHNGADDVAFDAVLMALACPGQPVRVQWTRADELSKGPLASAHRVQLEARLDEQGRITHWRHEGWANGYSSRPGRAKVPALLAATQREGGQPLPLAIDPPAAGGFGAQRNAIPGYAFEHLRVMHNRLSVMPLRTSAMRALGAFTNVFAIESFMDELAAACGQDPLEFRRRHLTDARALAVLDEAVARSAWWRARAQAPEGCGHGLAWARYKNSGAWCAVLARVAVAEQVRVLALDIAVDVGMVIDRDGVINQIEGGAIQATSWTLKESVAFDAHGVTSTGWESYPILRFSEVPQVTVHVIDRPQEPSVGAGEAAQGPVAAAIANAVADALGVRVRSLPLTPEQVMQAIDAADGGPSTGAAG